MVDTLTNDVTEKTMTYSDFCALCDKEVELSVRIFRKVCKEYIRRCFINVFKNNPGLECEIFEKKESLGYHIPRTLEQVILVIGRESFSDQTRACKLFPEL